MDYLFAKREKIKESLHGKTIALFLDYDGTLTPIVRAPDKAVLSCENRNLLKKLSAKPKCSVAIISGRALKDIKKMIGIKGLVYAGNHGLEIEGPNIKFEFPLSLRYRKILKTIKSQLRQKLTGIKGALVEDKRLTLSVHYRLVNKIEFLKLKSILDKITSVYAQKNKIKIKRGKKIFEIRPAVKWNKAKAVLWLLSRRRLRCAGKNLTPVYIGDDVTDEDAFKALKNKGLTVFVGRRRKSNAGYYLKGTKEVKTLLGQILKL